MPELARPGDFCPNSECDDYGKLQSEGQTNIIRFGGSKAGRQRYKCETCNRTFVETKGTIFYGRRTPENGVIDTLTLIGEDSRISRLARAKGHKEETIIDWIRAAGQHAERVEEVLLAGHKIERGQLDGHQRSNALSQVGSIYRPVRTLRVEIRDDPKRRWKPRTPAMTARLSDHIWTVKELLTIVVLPNNT